MREWDGETSAFAEVIASPETPRTYRGLRRDMEFDKMRCRWVFLDHASYIGKSDKTFIISKLF